MTYAGPGWRRDLITGLRALAHFLEDSPQIPAPYSVDVLVFPPDAPDEDGRAEIDRIAVLTGARIDDRTAEYGHYTASRVFGPVEYRAVFIPPRTRAYYEARGSYSGSIIPGPDQEV
jgi:hypothetical protein